MRQLLSKYLTEFVGTFFLVLTTGLSMGSGSPHLAFLSIGAVYGALVYLGSRLSGAHYNPALTVAAFIRGDLDLRDTGFYVLVQLLAGLASAALVGLLVLDDAYVFELRPGRNEQVIQALLVEMLFTFLLALVMLLVLPARSTTFHTYYGLAMALVLMAAYFAAAPISGGAFNPAVGLGANLLSGGFDRLWIYLLGPLLGGTLAGFSYRLFYPGG